jgi:hypothetical protein
MGYQTPTFFTGFIWKTLKIRGVYKEDRLKMKSSGSKTTCNEYRAEMILFGLQKRLNQENLTKQEQLKIKKEIENLESVMGMD